MNRRNFLKHTTALGLAFCAPLKAGWSADTESIEQFFVLVDAGGGWDPTSLCDPKGNAKRMDGRGPINRFYTDDIGTISNSAIQYAPFPHQSLLNTNAPGLREDMPISNFSDFFNRHYNNMMIINGIDVETVSHSVGSRNTWSGSNKEGTPSFSALASANNAPDSLMSFLSYGGYDFTANLVPSTRVNNATMFQELAFPNRPNVYDNNRHYLKPNIYQKIEQAKQQRLQRKLDTTLLPQRRAALNRLLNTKTNGLESIISEMEKIKTILPNQTFSKGLKGQAELAAASFAAGTSASVNLSISGLDTHSNHDRDHSYRLAELIDAVDHLWDMLALLNIADKTTVIIGSDFGRTPFYNDDHGKDHWNITSMILMGAGIPGNRVIGATNEDFNALKLDPTTLAIASNQDNAKAIKLTPAHIHVALQQHFGIDNNGYSLSAPLLPLFK